MINKEYKSKGPNTDEQHNIFSTFVPSISLSSGQNVFQMPGRTQSPNVGRNNLEYSKLTFMKSKLFIFVFVANCLNGHGQHNDSLHLSLIDSNLRAQTQNQLSQARYYSNLKSQPDTHLGPILSVLIAGLISFGSAAYLSIRSLKNDREKSIALQEKEFSSLKKLAASDLISKTAQGFHNVAWVLWIAHFTPKLFEISHVEDHDNKMNVLYAEIVGAQVILAAHDKELYESTKEIVDELYDLDGNLGDVAGQLYDPTKKSQSIKELGDMWIHAHKYLRNIPVLFSSKLKN